MQPRYIVKWVARFHGHRVALVPWCLEVPCLMTPRRQGCSGPRRSSRSRDIGTWVPGARNGLGHGYPKDRSVPRFPGIQRSRSRPYQGAQRTSRHRQLGTFNIIDTLAHCLDGDLAAPRPNAFDAPSFRMPHGPRPAGFPRCLGNSESRRRWSIDRLDSSSIEAPGSREDPGTIYGQRTGNPRVPRSLQYLGSRIGLISRRPHHQDCGVRWVDRCRGAPTRGAGMAQWIRSRPTGLVPSRPARPATLEFQVHPAHRRHRYQGIKAPMKPGPSMPVSRGEQAAKADDRPWSLATRLPEPLA